MWLRRTPVEGRTVPAPRLTRRQRQALRRSVTGTVERVLTAVSALDGIPVSQTGHWGLEVTAASGNVYTIAWVPSDPDLRVLRNEPVRTVAQSYRYRPVIPYLGSSDGRRRAAEFVHDFDSPELLRQVTVGFRRQLEARDAGLRGEEAGTLRAILGS